MGKINEVVATFETSEVTDEGAVVVVAEDAVVTLTSRTADLDAVEITDAD